MSRYAFLAAALIVLLPTGPCFAVDAKQKMATCKFGADQQRLQRHFDEIRDLEVQVAATPPPQTSTCVKPADPAPDPALGGNQGVDGTGNTTYDQNLGYSDEEDRARTFVGLIHMAMVCDLARVASLQLTLFQSHMNMFSLTGQGCDLHEVGHFGAGRDTTTQMAKLDCPRGLVKPILAKEERGAGAVTSY